MLYKYSNYIDDIQGCPPSHYQARECIVYRWVYEDMNHPHDFLPVAVIEPRRVNSQMDLQNQCKAYGLSMYNTMENARQQYLAITTRHSRFAAKIGEYVAEGQLAQSDGVISLPDKRTGHLTFHEYADVELTAKFVIKGRADGHE